MSSDTRIKVSVILPVYNVEGYIGRCIESLRGQTLKDLEFIFVDDCSTDGSMEAVEAWATKDERVHILQNDENMGAGPSRNRGIETARGEYLSFVDPDDYVSPDFYKLLYAAAMQDGGHDIAKGVRKKVDEKGFLIQESHLPLNEKIRRHLTPLKPLYTVFNYEHTTALYRRSLFRDGDVRYGTPRTSQDTTFLLRCCCQTEDIVIEERAVYFYVQRDSSAVHEISLRRILDDLDALAEKAEFFENRNIDQNAQSYLNEKFISINSKFYYLTINDSLPVDATNEYMTKLKDLVERPSTLFFLSRESPEYRALIEWNTPLPRLGYLPEQAKVNGAISWIGFIRDNHITEAKFVNSCASCIVSALNQLTGAHGMRGFENAHSQIAREVRKLPARQRVTIWLKVYRRLAAERYLRPTLDTLKRKG